MISRVRRSPKQTEQTVHIIPLFYFLSFAKTIINCLYRRNCAQNTFYHRSSKTEIKHVSFVPFVLTFALRNGRHGFTEDLI